MLPCAANPTTIKRRSAIVLTSQSLNSSRCRVVWVFAADRRWSRPCSSRQGARCPGRARVHTFSNDRPTAEVFSLSGAGTAAAITSEVPPTTAGSATDAGTAAAAAWSAGAGVTDSSPTDDDAGGPPPADPDATLDGFVSAFGLPRQQLCMVLERQPALQRANPRILAQRIAAYERATGLDVYQLLYMAARQPSFLRLAPAAFRERCEALAKSLALGFDDVLKVLVSQPAFLEVQPDSLRAVSGRVAGELGVRPGAALRVLARMPPGELRAVFSRQQPGLMRERLAGLRRLLRKTFGPRRATPEAALLLVTRCPPLLALPTKFVEASLEALMSIPPTKGAVGGAIGGGGAAAAGRSRSRSTMLRALLSCPQILTLPPETLRERFVMLAAAARIDMPAVVSMLLLQPRVLLADPARVRQRLEGLTFSLMVPRSAALDMVVRQPQLLLYNTETLAENWAGLQKLLGIPFDSALSIVTRHPNLLCVSQAKLTSKLTALEAIFSLPRPRAVLLAVEKPVLLTMSEESYLSAHRVLAPLLALPSPAHLGRLVCREPYLVLESTVKLTAKVSLAASLLGISEAEVGGMLARSPHFITKELSYWQTNLDTVTGGLGVSLERAREVTVRFPYLLAADPTDLLSVASANMALVRSSPAWMALLEKADAESLFKCLAGFNDRNREHLQYLVDAGMQREVSFLNSIIWNRAAFTRRFPRFPAWQAARRAAGTASNGLPLPRSAPAWPPPAATSQSPAHAGGSEPGDAAPDRESDLRSGHGSAMPAPTGEAGVADEALAEVETYGGSASLLQEDTANHEPLRQDRGDESTTGGASGFAGPARLEAGVGSQGVGSGVAAGPAAQGSGAVVATVARVVFRRPVSRRRQVRRMPSLSSTDDEPQQPQVLQ